MNLSPRALMSLLFNGEKAIDVVRTALDLGLLDTGPATLGELADRFGLLPQRLHKLLDCLECLGFVHRRQQGDALLDTEYRIAEGARQAAADVLGPGSQELDRDGYPWRTLHGRLPEVLRGELRMPEEAFVWPPADQAQVASFEQSMAVGLGPIIESFQAHAGLLRGRRLLDIGGGDGTLAQRLVEHDPAVRADVYNLESVRPLVDTERIGFVAGDFLTEPLPTGYDVLSFVRVLHDWPPETARMLLTKAHTALPAGGRVLICEEFRTTERLAAQFFWSYFLIGVDSCSSLLREAEYYLRLLGELGFTEIEVLPGPFEIITAVRP